MNVEINMEQAILESATQLFLKKGFKATSTTEIAKEAGCNQALVHYYFRTKERLFEAIFEKKLKFFVGSLLDIGNSELPFYEKLTKKVESHFEAIRNDPRLPLFFFSELSSNPGRVEAIKEAVGEIPAKALEQMDRELQQEIAEGRVRQTTIRDLLLTIVSMNIMVFLGAPMIKIMMGLSDEAYE
ncbi:TetR/AcrR family transcriptional regulator, partial [Lutimonas sp.]|uniref:TetR/AcrR family transcriptional regulator n=1 Tax=Lutimonas sp. TaxID=1872403 RepID=UPI003C720BC6